MKLKRITNLHSMLYVGYKVSGWIWMGPRSPADAKTV